MTTSIEVTSAFNEMVDLTLETVADSSARIYRQTFNLWRDWCGANGANSLDLRPALVSTFLASENATKTTKQRQLSALRKLAQMIYVLNPNETTRQNVEALKMIKAPASNGGKERIKRALSPSEAHKILCCVWTQDTNKDKRNAALIAVLALGALRRSEAAILQWQDIDLENGVISIHHGKGDKRREVPLAGDLAVEALLAWKAAQPEGYKYVFVPVSQKDAIESDHPISGTDVYRIVKATEALAGIEFKPHDLRRTFITEALATGTPLSTVQAIAGHSRGETTLRYAQTVNAREQRKTLKLRYA